MWPDLQTQSKSDKSRSWVYRSWSRGFIVNVLVTLHQYIMLLQLKTLHFEIELNWLLPCVLLIWNEYSFLCGASFDHLEWHLSEFLFFWLNVVSCLATTTNMWCVCDIFFERGIIFSFFVFSGDSKFVCNSRSTQCAVELREQDRTGRHTDEAEALHKGYESWGKEHDTATQSIT